ncbi:MAG: hypothetical protein JSU86_20420, partial [Phycisphaerales bacterium]
MHNLVYSCAPHVLARYHNVTVRDVPGIEASTSILTSHPAQRQERLVYLSLIPLRAFSPAWQACSNG